MHEVVSNAKRVLLVGVICLALVGGDDVTAGASTVEDSLATQSARPCWVFCW